MSDEDVLVNMQLVVRAVVDEIHAFLDLTKWLLKSAASLFLRKTRERWGDGDDGEDLGKLDGGDVVASKV